MVASLHFLYCKSGANLPLLDSGRKVRKGRVEESRYYLSIRLSRVRDDVKILILIYYLASTNGARHHQTIFLNLFEDRAVRCFENY